MKIQKTHPALRLRFLRGNKYHLAVVAQTYTLTPWSMYLCHNELSCPSPACQYTPRTSQQNPFLGVGIQANAVVIV